MLRLERCARGAWRLYSFDGSDKGCGRVFCEKVSFSVAINGGEVYGGRFLDGLDTDGTASVGSIEDACC